MRGAALLIVFSLFGCFEAPCETPFEPGVVTQPCFVQRPADAGLDAGGRIDAGRLDAGLSDAGFDAGGIDAGFDAGLIDAGFDAGVFNIEVGGIVPVVNGSTRLLEVFVTAALDDGFLIESAWLDGGPAMLQVDLLRNLDTSQLLIVGPDPATHMSRSYANLSANGTLVLESDDFSRHFTSGPYQFVVKATDAFTERPLTGSVWVRVTKKRKPAAATPQRMALNLFFTGSAGLTSTTSLSQQRFVNALTSTAALLGDAGIVLDPIRRFDLPAGFSSISGTSEFENIATPGTKTLEALVVRSANAPPGMNVFFVETLQPHLDLPPGAVLGIAGGIPGTTMRTGTRASGVAVLYDTAVFMPRRPGHIDTLGATIAHEVGHQLGLSHLYSLSNDGLDNLSDTPDDEAADDYLMAPTAMPSATRLSPMQGSTMRRNPVVAP